MSQIAEISSGEFAKEMIIDDQSLRGDLLNVCFALSSEAKQNASAVARVLTFLYPTTALQSSCFKGNECGCHMKVLSDPGDAYPAGSLVLSDDHHDVVLRRCEAG